MARRSGHRTRGHPAPGERQRGHRSGLRVRPRSRDRFQRHWLPRRARSDWATHAEAVLSLACAVRERRTETAKQATVLAQQGFTQQQIAQELDIAQSSVSRRLSSALWSQEQAVHPTVLTFLELANEQPEAP